MSQFMNRLREDHARLGRAVTAMRAHIGSRDRDERGAWLDLLASLVDYVAEYPDVVHHPREDRLFERLVDQGLTPAERQLVAMNLAEHAKLAEATERLMADVDAVLAGATLSETDLATHALNYLDLQVEHMRREEAQLFPLAERLLSEADFEALDQELAAQRDPLFEQRATRYDDLLEFIAA